jgi:hypothetical protein
MARVSAGMTGVSGHYATQRGRVGDAVTIASGSLDIHASAS